MPIARKNQISLDDTRYYHCISRCVRRAFLFGIDRLTKRSFDHRKDWLVKRFHQLSAAFAIRICAYSVMSNHYHLVLYVDSDQAAMWPEEEVNKRWSMIFKSSDVKPNKSGTGGDCEGGMSPTEIKRKRLQDISWFMRCLNEYIARRANKEDECKGRFWEGRFKSQALMDQGAVLACMVYVDLNPVRAGLAAAPEESEYTSIWERIQEYQLGKTTENQNSTLSSETKDKESKRLMPFQLSLNINKTPDRQKHVSLPIVFSDYLELVDWTGRQLISNNKAAISPDHSPILSRLKLNQDGWFKSVTGFESKFFRVAGKLETLQKIGQKFGVKWLKGQSLAIQLYLAEV